MSKHVAIIRFYPYNKNWYFMFREIIIIDYVMVKQVADGTYHQQKFNIHKSPGCRNRSIRLGLSNFQISGQTCR
jgi:hypothetical protein